MNHMIYLPHEDTFESERKFYFFWNEVLLIIMLDNRHELGPLKSFNHIQGMGFHVVRIFSLFIIIILKQDPIRESECGLNMKWY